MKISSRADRQIITILLDSFQSEVPSSRESSCDSLRFSWLEQLLNEADFPSETFRTRVLLLSCVLLLVAVWAGMTVAILLFLACFGSSIVLLSGRARKRRIALDRDLPALLSSVASSVRAGIDPLLAVAKAREYFPADSVLKKELERFHSQLSSGLDEDEVIGSFCASVRHPDIPLLKGCLLLSRRHGSSLAEPLHRVTRVIRQRQSFRRKTRAALAMHRMSAIGIVVCALLICGIQAAMNVEGIRLALQHPTGSKMLATGMLLIVSGVGWMMSFGRETEA